MVAFYFNELNANNKFQIPPSVSTKTYVAAPLSGVFADHREQESISLYLSVPRPLKAAPTPCCSRPAFSDLPMSQVFARAVPDASKPFLPPVYIFSVTQLSALSWIIVSSGSVGPHPLGRCPQNMVPLSFQHLSQFCTFACIREIMQSSSFPEDSLGAGTTLISFAFAYHSVPQT